MAEDILMVKKSVQESVQRILSNTGLKSIDMANMLGDFNITMGTSLKGADEDTVSIAFIAYALGHINMMSPGSLFNKNYGGRLSVGYRVSFVNLP